MECFQTFNICDFNITHISVYIFLDAIASIQPALSISQFTNTSNSSTSPHSLDVGERVYEAWQMFAST